MAAFLAALAAVFFALAAALQQRGQFALARDGKAVKGVAQLVRLLAVPIWLLGTVVLFARLCDPGRGTGSRQARRRPAAAGDDDRVGAAARVTGSPAQSVVRRQVLGAVSRRGRAGAVRAGRRSRRRRRQRVDAGACVIAMRRDHRRRRGMLLLWLRSKSAPALRAAVLGVCAGLYFGLSATLREAGHQRPARQHRRGRRRLAHLGAAGLRVRRVPHPADVARDRPARAGDGGGLGLEPGGQRAARDRAVRGAADAPRLARRSSPRGACWPRSAGAVLITLANRETRDAGHRSLRTSTAARGGPGARVTIDVVLLALASTVRPTSLAAVYALLSARRTRGG